MKIVSVSLYGREPMYLKGAIENARLVREVYPDWQLWVYVERGLDTEELKELGCAVFSMSKSRKHSGMFWRFLAAWQGNAEYVIFRDVDSRFNSRESAAVNAWIKSGELAHGMKDHPHHARLPIFGGMWGIQGGCLPLFVKHQLERQMGRFQKRVADMDFLAKQVLPHIKDSYLIHSSVPTLWPSQPFPEHSPYDGFVGQQYDEFDNPIVP